MIRYTTGIAHDGKTSMVTAHQGEWVRYEDVKECQEKLDEYKAKYLALIASLTQTGVKNGNN